MATVTNLPGVAQTEVKRLQNAGYSDTDRLWEAVEDQGLEAVGKRVSVKPARLAELLGAQEVAEARKARAPWRDHLGGMFIQSAWSAVIASAIVGIAYLITGPISRVAIPPRSVTYAVVGPADGIPAYQILSADDVSARSGSVAGEDLVTPESVAGRYALQPLASGEILRRSHISPHQITPEAMKGRRIVSLSTSISTVPEVSLPEPVTLVFSPLPSAPATSAPEVVEGVLLNMRRATDRTILDVAVQEADLPRLGRVVGQSVLVVATQAPTVR